MRKLSLSPREHQFVQAVMYGESQSAAYRYAYKPKPTATQRSIHVLASRVAKKVDIQLRLNDYSQTAEARLTDDLEQMRRAVRLWKESTSEKNSGSTRVSALSVLSKVIGLAEERIAVRPVLSAEQVQEELQRRLEALLG